MKVFKKKMGFIRFHVDSSEPLSGINEVCSDLAASAFSGEDSDWAGGTSVSGFTTASDPFNGDNFIPSEVEQSGFVCAFFRRDSRHVSPNAIEREFLHKYAKRPSMKRSEVKEAKEQIKHRLLSTAPVKMDIVPFALNLSTREGFFFSTTNSLFEEFQAAFTGSLGVDIIPVDFNGDDARDKATSSEFLTWMWWKMETDGFSVPSGKRIFVSGRISARSKDAEKAMTGDMTPEETKLAISGGCDVTKMEITLEGDEESFVVFRDGVVSGLHFEKEDLPSEESLSWLAVLTKADKVSRIMESWREMFTTQEQVAYARGKKSWIKPSICTREIEEI